MKTKALEFLKILGNVQARVMLALFFFLILTPYGLLLRCIRHKLLPGGGWMRVEHAKATLDDMRRSF